MKHNTRSRACQAVHTVQRKMKIKSLQNLEKNFAYNDSAVKFCDFNGQTNKQASRLCYLAEFDEHGFFQRYSINIKMAININYNILLLFVSCRVVSFCFVPCRVVPFCVMSCRVVLCRPVSFRNLPLYSIPLRYVSFRIK